MKCKKRFTKMGPIILSIVVGIILGNVIFNYMQNEQRMKSSYEYEKQKYELLKDIANESIQEGIGIDTSKISNDEIQYYIYENNGNIIFYYYLKEDVKKTPPYNATITLSNKYKILQEEYSVNIKSFDEYVKLYTFKSKYISIFFAYLCGLFSYAWLIILINFYFLLIDTRKYITANNNKLYRQCSIKK